MRRTEQKYTRTISAWNRAPRPWLLLLLAACAGKGDDSTSAGDTHADTADTGDTAETGDTADTGETGDTTGDSDTGVPEGRTGVWPLADADAVLVGSSGELAGDALAWPGDVNGDGYDDLYVGASESDLGVAEGGAVYLLLGPVSGEVPLTEADAQIAGMTPRQRAGAKLGAGGDLNGDGAGDTLVGIWDAGQGAGQAWMVSGATRGGASLDDGPTLWGVDAGSNAGFSVAIAPDVNGDGIDDALVGANHDGADLSGTAWLVLGPIDADLSLADADVTWHGEAANDQLGAAVGGGGDIDGDGHGDVLLGADGDTFGLPGKAYVLRGPAPASLADADAVLTGEAPDDVAGNLVRGRDLDGDGRSDLLVDAYENDTAGINAGAAYLWYGPVSGALSLRDAPVKVLGLPDAEHFAEAIDFAGDTNQDGVGEILLGAHVHGPGGAAYLFEMPPTAGLTPSDARVTFTANAANDEGGWEVCGGGDVDNDGWPDLWISARREATTAAQSGRVYLFRGGPGGE